MTTCGTLVNPLQARADALRRCVPVARAFPENIQDMTVLLDAAPPGVALAMNGEKHHIKVLLQRRP